MVDATADAVGKKIKEKSITEASEITERLLKTIAVDFVGLAMPLFDVITLLSLTFDIASFLMLLFRDNIYESWAKASHFSKSEGYALKFETPALEYLALLDLLALPQFTAEYDAKKGFHAALSLANYATQDMTLKIKHYLVLEASEIIPPAYYTSTIHSADIAIPLEIPMCNVYDLSGHFVSTKTMRLDAAALKMKILQFVLTFTALLRRKFSKSKDALLSVDESLDLCDQYLDYIETNVHFKIVSACQLEVGKMKFPNKALLEALGVQEEEEEEVKGVEKLLELEASEYFIKKINLTAYLSDKKVLRDTLKETFDLDQALVSVQSNISKLIIEESILGDQLR